MKIKGGHVGFALHLIAMVVFGLALYAAYEFVVGNLPNLFSYGPKLPFSGEQPFAHRLTVLQHLESGPFGLFNWLMYYVTGIGAYLMLGIMGAEVLRHVAEVAQYGYKEAKKIRIASRRKAIEEERRRAVIEEQREAHRPAHRDAQWSVGAVMFGVALGVALF